VAGVMLDFLDLSVPPKWVRAESQLFTEGPAAHNTLYNTSWFNEVFTYHDHGSRLILSWVFCWGMCQRRR